MHPRELFETQLDVIERAVERVCRDARLAGADAEDFASSARLALLADDYAVLRQFEGRASFATYITVIVRRFLVDQQRKEGRWYSSAEAQRRGAAAVLLERLVHRDRRSLDDAVSIVRGEHPGVSKEELHRLAAQLPERTARPRLVEIAPADEERFASSSSADERVIEHDLGKRSDATSRIVRDALHAMTAQDRVILRLRFAKGVAISDIARALALPQRPLYRRIEALLADLRRALQREGIDAASAGELIGRAGEQLDFGPAWKSGEAHPSIGSEGDGGFGERTS